MHPVVSGLQFDMTVIRQGSSIIVNNLQHHCNRKDALDKVTLIRLVFGGGGIFTDAHAFTDGVCVKVAVLVLYLYARSRTQLALCSVSFGWHYAGVE